MPSLSSKRTLLWTTAAYGAAAVVAVVVFMLVRAWGESLLAPAPTAAEPLVEATAKPDELLRVLIALAAIIITGQVLARLFALLRQPPVIGEVVAGILLGPSLIGPTASALILPAQVAPHLGVIAQIGVILYMFIIGLELNAELLRDRAHALLAIAHSSMLAPFLLGLALALFLYPRLSTSNVPFTSFALFMGVALSITAFPVLARILTDLRLTRTELGMVALGAAALGDATAWCLLALIIGVAKAHMEEGFAVAGYALVYVAVMLIVVRPIVKKLAVRWSAENLPRGAVALVFTALLLSALGAEYCGIHAIFGAFLLGALVPEDSAPARVLTRQLEPVVSILLLPAFFAFTGMRTRIDLVSGLEQWLICGLIIVMATVGKVGGTVAAARLAGMRWRGAGALGALMNTRGLMELIVLNIGLDLRIISPTLFSMMVLMALATTMATSPVLFWLLPEVSRRPPADGVDSSRQIVIDMSTAAQARSAVPGE